MRGRFQTGQTRTRRSAAAFTLIEITISAALMSLILVSAYMCLHASLASQKLIEPRVRVVQNARVAMALLTADLRAACPLSTNYQFLGVPQTIGDAEADTLNFATHNYKPARPREADFCEVSYSVEPDPATGRLTLWRRRNPVLSPDPLLGGRREQIAKGLTAARFEYYDGLDWYDNWGETDNRKSAGSFRSRPNLSGMPEAVRITLAFAAGPRAPKGDTAADTGSQAADDSLTFETVARLELAAISRETPASSSSSSSSSTNSAGGGATQTLGPGGPN